MMFYPVADLVYLFFFRVFNNKNPFSADRNHIHHVLQEMKFTNTKIQFILFSINILPLIIYELTKINILLFFFMNVLIYYLIISKKLIFLKQ